MASVTVYGLDQCPACKATKDFLKEKDIPFTYESDVEKIKEALERGNFKEIGVPVIEVCKDDKEPKCELFMGFDPKKLLETLK